MNPQAQQTAIIAMYMMLGAASRIRNHGFSTDLDEVDGHLGLAHLLYERAEQASNTLSARLAAGACSVGVFEYEIAEELGYWVTEFLSHSEQEFQAELDRLCDRFFSRD